jgi:glycerophosphoryl diester phosphodiesterase
MIIYAHRGARAYAPENTMIAFQKALLLGADGIELDVHMTKDAEVVVCHDPIISHTSDGAGLVKDHTLAELKRYDFGKWFNAQYAGEQIPTLREVLQWIAPTPMLLNIEIKNGPFIYTGIERKIIDLIEHYRLTERVIISSFYHPSLKLIKNINPALKTGVLFACRPVSPTQFLVDTRADFFHPCWAFLDAELVQIARSLHIGINTYTVNEPVEYEFVHQFDIDGIFTDYPDVYKNK